MRSDNAGGNLFVDKCERKNERSRFAAGALAIAAAGTIESFSLHSTASTMVLRRIRILVLADGTPYRRDLRQDDVSTRTSPSSSERK